MEVRWVDQLEKLALWHQVSSARFLGPVRFRQLWRIYGDDIGRVFHMSDGELSRIKGVFNRQSQTLARFHEASTRTGRKMRRNNRHAR